LIAALGLGGGDVYAEAKRRLTEAGQTPAA
jgi:hypothetical protein